LPFLRPRALEKRRGDGKGRGIARAVIHDGGPGLERAGLRRTGNAHHPAHRLYYAVDSGVALLRPGLSVTRHGAENDAPIDLLQILVTEAVARHGAAPEILDDHIGARGHPAEYRLPG